MWKKTLIRMALPGVIAILLTAFSHASLKVGVSDQDDRTIVVDIDAPMDDVMAYLLWVDLDAGHGDGSAPRILSWRSGDKWVEGLFPIIEEKVDIGVLQNAAVTTLPSGCPSGHRCFAVGALVGEALDHVVLSVYPLSKEAMYERMPGQWMFLDTDPAKDLLYEEAQAIYTTGEAVDEVSNSQLLESDQADSRGITEKPDIYKLVHGGQGRPTLLLLAMTKAKKFVVIDFQDADTPRKIAEFPIKGAPREIYYLDDVIYLISEGENSTVVSSFKRSDQEITEANTRELAGRLRESRRRDEYIFVITDSMIYVLSQGTDGRINVEDSRSLQSYPRLVSICRDFLTMVFNDTASQYRDPMTAMKELSIEGDEGNSVTLQETEDIEDIEDIEGIEDIEIHETLRAYYIGGNGSPLSFAGDIMVNGRIPSDLHINCMRRGDEPFLVFVTAPPWSNPESGSTLFIYSLQDKEDGNVSFRMAGALHGIAPGEQLFGTVITEDRAYVVTYERQDPLWVVNIFDPYDPWIMGELEVPGWSEKLFIDGERLLSVGYLDTHPSSQQQIMLVSVGLFDVSDPGAPKLVSRLTPFLGDVYYSWSEATSDERAFYVNWERGLFAMPLHAYFKEKGQWILAFSLDGLEIREKGLSNVPFSPRRVLWVDDSRLVAFSERDLITFSSTGDQLVPLLRIPMVTAVDGLAGSLEDELFWGISGEYGVERVYLIHAEKVRSGLPLSQCIEDEKDITFDGQGFSLETGGGKLLIYRHYPLVVEFLNKDSQHNIVSSGPFELMVPDEKVTSIHEGPPSFGGGMVVFPCSAYRENMWTDGVLPVFIDGLKEGEKYKAACISVPGTMVGVTREGLIVTMEPVTGKDSISPVGTRLNLLYLEKDRAVLLKTTIFKECPGYTSWVQVDKDAIYLACRNVPGPYPLLETKQEVTIMPQPQYEYAVLLKIDVPSLEKTGEYKLDPMEYPVKVNGENGLLLTRSSYAPIYYYGAYPEVLTMPYRKVIQGCILYRMSSQGGLEEIFSFDASGCYDADRVLFSADTVLTAEEEQGLNVEIVP